MSKSLFLSGLFILLLSGNYAISAPDSFLLKNGDSIVFLGDSITQMGGQPGGYVELFKDFCATNKLDIKVINSGIGGHKSNDMMVRLDKDVLSYKPTWVSVSCGVNDVWHNFMKDQDGNKTPKGLTLDQYKMFMTEIVDKCLEAKIKVLLLTATPIMEKMDSEENKAAIPYNEFLRQLAQEKKILLCDLSKVFNDKYVQKKDDKNLLTTDGVHMNPEGNKLMTASILSSLGATKDQLKKLTAKTGPSDKTMLNDTTKTNQSDKAKSKNTPKSGQSDKAKSK